MAQPPTKPKTTSPNQKRQVAPAKGLKMPVAETGLKTSVGRAMSALRAYFAKANGYEAAAMVLFAGVLIVIIFARPVPDRLSTVLRILALVTAMAAKFMANAGLSANPGTASDQATAKRLSLLMDGVAVGLTAISFFVPLP